jgi:hypothetical protein
MEIAVLGIDLDDADGKVTVRHRMHRGGVIRFDSGLAPCVVAMGGVPWCARPFRSV